MTATALFVLLAATGQVDPPQAAPSAGKELQEVMPEQRWGGVLPNESLRKAAPATGVVLSQEAFEELWSKWRPGEKTPDVDFKRSLVLVETIDGPNRMFASLRTDAAGDLRTTFGGTKIGGPGFGYLIVLVPRDGIRTIKGQPVGDGPPRPDQPNEPRDRPQRPDGPAQEVVRVAIQGRLETGIVAIGGETTGTIVRSNGMTFELSFDEPLLERQALRLDGRPAFVTGDLTMRPGVESGPRWIVEVNWIAPAESPSRNPRSRPRER